MLYHISRDGVANPCNASKGRCPLGVHSECASPEEAAAFAERISGLRHGGGTSFGKSAVHSKIAEDEKAWERESEADERRRERDRELGM